MADVAVQVREQVSGIGAAECERLDGRETTERDCCYKASTFEDVPLHALLVKHCSVEVVHLKYSYTLNFYELCHATNSNINVFY